MDIKYSPKDLEASIYKKWTDNDCFSAKDLKSNYSIVLPPPNVTGTLHMGHAFQHTIIDILIRYNRMLGKSVLWQPGTDHAGIATQLVVENNLAREGKTRHDIGRKALVDEIWKWKEKSGNTIISQTKRIGSSADWSRNRFTMDDGLSDAVKKVFITLYNEGVIYRGNRLINWDIKLQTAISDLEVTNVEKIGHLYHIKYEIEDSEKTLTVATTRPETLFGDTAICVNPNDERYKDLINKKAKLPLTNRLIKIISDDSIDMDFGTGCVKITPAHDFNDYKLGKKHNLEFINILNKDGTFNSNVGNKFKGIGIHESRKLILAELKNIGLLGKIEDYKTTIPYGDRSNTIIEPYLTFQWYCNAKELAKDAIAAVKSNKTEFFPSNWDKTYFQWMENIRPWCISRQIWWGHQIPIWYGPDGKEFCAETEDLARAEAINYYKADKIILKRDKDVLDTWFSSALWPFATLGWPKNNKVLDNFYPNSVLVTGFDIIFFWVARMMMMGNKFMKETPFKTVYIHALVRDENGKKMSKSKGNVIDPLEIIDRYGSDTLRFTLTSLNTPGRDVRLSEQRIAGYRNFITKIVNAFRYAEFKNIYPLKNKSKIDVNNIFNLWILDELQKTNKEIQKLYKGYLFHEVANKLYHFTWHTFCDWYIEISKTLLDGDDCEETKYTFNLVFNSLLQLLHPIVPFITEKLWQQNNETTLMIKQWKDIDISIDQNSLKKANLFISFVEEIRSLEKLFEIKKDEKIELYSPDVNLQEILISNKEIFEFMTRKKLKNLPIVNSVTLPFKDKEFQILFENSNFEKIKEKLTKNKNTLDKEEISISRNLSNTTFIEKAPEELISQNTSRLKAIKLELIKINSILSNI